MRCGDCAWHAQVVVMEKGLNVFIRGMYGEYGGYYAILEVFDALFPYILL
jgi:hypothetical protein